MMNGSGSSGNGAGSGPTAQEPPRIEFPCEYPIKIMGEAVEGFEADVLAVVRRHVTALPDDRVTRRPSAKGNYLALTVVIDATGLEQLERLFADLKSLAAVKLVL